ncbi:hypothetical protein [Pseudoxanthomonas daejeonensis]|uniref:DUF2975 domain-containing protein n=1 Tax=Pseudoxanthomonas daejeonensis TaxID=266062 RepID=A0ABQ6Z630_9GAMM|nr:hypothetical protein [Pseudoxanthomonas daejeonensis]KAF1693842.1 hypothetical protein CSC65_11220 [Pseudoxanthomonas daejeonensis]
MDTRTYIINEQYIRKCGRIVSILAILGQIALVYSLVRVPWVLYWIQEPVTGMQPVEFMRHAYLRGEFASLNLLGMIKTAVAAASLEFVRRLGTHLSSASPLGERTARSLGNLRWPCLAMSIALSFTAQVLTDCWLSKTSTLEFRNFVDLDFSAGPLYFGILGLIGLTLLQRIIQQALIPKTESESFV